MNQLVIQQNGNPVTTSRLVANKFGKRHDHVVRAVKNLECSENFKALNFGEGSYVHPKNKQEHTEIIMTKDGFTFLVMGFTGKEASKFKEQYIEAFNVMDSELKAQQNLLPAQATETIHQLTTAVSKLTDRIDGMELNSGKTEYVTPPVIEGYATVPQFVDEINFPITSGENIKIQNAAVLVCRKNRLEIKTWEDDIYGKSYKYYPKSALHKAVSSVFSF